MNRNKHAVIFYVLMAFSLSGILLISCGREIGDGTLIFTQVTGKPSEISNTALDAWRYKVQSRIVSIHPDNPGKSFRVLTSDFYSALAPRISYDGKFLLFAGRQKQNDPWQIWEMNLANLKVRQVLSAKEDCADPEYLPGERVIFGKMIAGDTIKTGHSLFTCNLDGTKLQEITFDPRTYSSSAVLKDGRVLAITSRTFPSKSEPVLMVLRPDGTKSELFYNDVQDNTLASQPCETPDGKIVFIESTKTGTPAGRLISVKYNRPLHSRVSYSSEIKGSFRSVTSLNSGKLLVSYSPSENEKYSIYEFDKDNKSIGKPVYNSTEFDAAEVVVAEKHDRPKKLPSEVDPGVKTGLLLCQDINFSGMQNDGKVNTITKTDRIEIVGADSSLGVVQAHKDGSVYLKVIADTPFRIRRLDDKGNILDESCDWIYLRPNERRGCIGCHEDNEMVPDNRLALAVKKAPLIIPVHKSNQKEKAIELE
jgi:hypothetical protein